MGAMAVDDRDLLATAFDRFATSAEEPLADDMAAEKNKASCSTSRTCSRGEQRDYCLFAS